MKNIVDYIVGEAKQKKSVEDVFNEILETLNKELSNGNLSYRDCTYGELAEISITKDDDTYRNYTDIKKHIDFIECKKGSIILKFENDWSGPSRHGFELYDKRMSDAEYRNMSRSERNYMNQKYIAEKIARVFESYGLKCPPIYIQNVYYEM